MLNSVRLESDIVWERNYSFQIKSFYCYLVCSVCCGTASTPHSSCSVRGCLSFGLLTSVIASIDCFLGLIVSAKLSVNSFSNNGLSCFEGKMPSPSTWCVVHHPAWCIILLHPEVHFWVFYMF